MIKSEFRNFKRILTENISICKVRLQIAVSWITHKKIFELILSKLNEGISIQLILNNDYINNRRSGIPLQSFIDRGGELFFYDDKGLMHNKFIIIDEKILINGSFNWTYRAVSQNCENILRITDEQTVQDFISEFENIINYCVKIKKVKFNNKPTRRYEIEIIQKEKNYENEDQIKKQVELLETGEINGWIVKPGDNAFLWDNCIQNNIHRFGFDKATFLINNFESTSKSELRKAYKNAYPEHKTEKSHILEKYFVRVSEKDLFFAANGRLKLIGIGIVKSHPKKYEAEMYKTYRDVEWIASFEDNPILLKNMLSMDSISELKFNNKNWEIIKKACA